MVIDERNWDYLDLSSGRYYCLEHGGFCDLSDGHALRCPLCNDGSSQKKRTNHVQRSLRLINGLQERSKRSFTLATSIFGGLGLLKVLDAPNSGGFLADVNALFAREEAAVAGYAQFVALLLLLLSIALFSWSMRHISVTMSNQIPKKTYASWTRVLNRKLRSMELCHWWGSVTLLLSVVALATSLIVPHTW